MARRVTGVILAARARARAVVHPAHWVAIVLVCMGLSTQAAHAAYKVDIDAPRDVRNLLRDHLDLSRFAKRRDLSAQQFDFLVTAAPQQARELIATLGYFSPVVQTDVRHPGHDETRVRVTVAPGPRTTVNSLSLSFTGPVQSEAPEQETAARLAWDLRPGEPFTEAAWSAAKNAALAALRKRRYLSAHIASSRAAIDPRAHTAALSVVFESGPTFHLGAIEISGMQRYPESIVQHLNPLHVGEIFDASRLQELQRQAQNTPYFASVAADVDPDPAHAQQAPVHLKVNEYPYQNVRSGVGYSTDTGGQLEAAYGYNNVFGRAWAFNMQGRLQRDNQYGLLQLSMPPDSRAYVNSVLTSYNRSDIQNTTINSFKLGVQRTRSLQYYDYNWSLMYYRDQLKPDFAGAQSTARALVPGWAWARRDVDDPVFPRKGNLVGVETGFAVKGLLSDQTFLRLYAHGRQYFPIGRNDLVLLRAELGGVFTAGSSNSIPASLLFRSGGSGTVRGYSFDSIGNKVAGSVLPVKYLITASAEYQHWFSHDWGGAVFYDIGTAADTWAERAIYTGVGVGARWRSPVGPINFDVGYGLRNQSIRPYLSLGIAF